MLVGDSYRWKIYDSSGKLIDLVEVKIKSWNIFDSAESIEPSLEACRIPAVPEGGRLCIEGNGSFRYQSAFVSIDNAISTGTYIREIFGSEEEESIVLSTSLLNDDNNTNFRKWLALEYPNISDPNLLRKNSDADGDGIKLSLYMPSVKTKTL